MSFSIDGATNEWTLFMMKMTCLLMAYEDIVANGADPAVAIGDAITAFNTMYDLIVP